MFKRILRIRVFLVMLLILTLFSPSVFARGGDRGGDRGHDRGRSHYYHDGRWYEHGWFGFGFAVSALTIGALIEALPPRHTTVVVDNTPYYHDDTYYYRQLPEGNYVVVAPPVVVQPQYQAIDVSTVNIPNSRGGYTSVTLRRSGNGYIGPQGEYYPNYPSVEQLRMMYGN
jgi:hypothetical protein